MSRVRTTPEAIDSIYEDRIAHFGVSIAYNPDGTINNDETKFSYSIAHLNGSDKAIGNDSEGLSKTDWTAQMLSDLQSLYQIVKARAVTQGYIGAGTDENEI